MSANFKASTDGTQAIIGVGGVDQMAVSNDGQVSFLNQIRLENNKAICFKASDNITSLPAFGVSNANVTYIKPVQSIGVVDLQNFAGTTVFRTTQDLSNPAQIYVNGALKQVVVGAADSAGVGFRTLRVTN